MKQPKWADMSERSFWKDEKHCEQITIQAVTAKAQSDLADYEPKIRSLMERVFEENNG